jgi:hypothetical protein
LKNDRFRPIALIATVLLATLFWFVTFYLAWSIFWIKISFSAATLAVLSLVLKPIPKKKLVFDGKAFIIGLFSAAILYFIFWSGKTISTTMFPFAGQQIGGIYDKGVAGPPVPCLPIFW